MSTLTFVADENDFTLTAHLEDGRAYRVALDSPEADNAAYALQIGSMLGAVEVESSADEDGRVFTHVVTGDCEPLVDEIEAEWSALADAA